MFDSADSRGCMQGTDRLVVAMQRQSELAAFRACKMQLSLAQRLEPFDRIIIASAILLLYKCAQNGLEDTSFVFVQS